MMYGMQMFGFSGVNQYGGSMMSNPYGSMGMYSQMMLGGSGGWGSMQGMGGYGSMQGMGSYGGGMSMGMMGMMPMYQYNQGKAWDTTLDSTLGRRDPIYLDTNHDGVLNKERLNTSINFDINGDGISDRVHEWNTKDAQLVYDANGDGQINSGREMMNEVGVNGEQGKYKNGWEKARDVFDKNKDGRIDGEELKSARFWTDANGDGKVDDGEMKTAAESGIVGIDTENGRFVERQQVGNMFFGMSMNMGWGGSNWGGSNFGGSYMNQMPMFPRGAFNYFG